MLFFTQKMKIDVSMSANLRLYDPAHKDICCYPKSTASDCSTWGQSHPH